MLHRFTVRLNSVFASGLTLASLSGLDRFLQNSLEEFGVPFELSPNDFLEPNCVIQIGNIPNRIDILTDIDGLDFENSWQNKNKIDFDGLNTYSLSLDDLIINKSSTKRAKDKLDLEQLKELSKISK